MAYALHKACSFLFAGLMKQTRELAIRIIHITNNKKKYIVIKFRS